MIRALAIAVALAVAAPAPALAAPRHHRARPTSAATYLNLALQDAQTFWGRPACGGDVRAQLDSSTPPAFAAGGWFEQPHTDPATWRGCVLHVVAYPFGDRWLDLYMYTTLCRIVLHEYGHALGLGHSTDPTNIMYATLTATIPPVCQLRADALLTVGHVSTPHVQAAPTGT